MKWKHSSTIMHVDTRLMVEISCTIVYTTLASYLSPLALIAWEEKKGLVPTVLLTSHFGMIFCKMSLRLCSSCVCLLDPEVLPKCPTALFIMVELKEDLPGRFSRLLLVPFAKGNSLLPFVCRNCRVKAESIETKLHKFWLSDAWKGVRHASV